MINPYHKQSAGFVILYAVLLVSIVLTISLTLLNITYKQLVSTALVRESRYAAAAADSGLDCTVFWDKYYHLMQNGGENPSADNQPFGYFDSTDPSQTYYDSNLTEIFCGEITSSDWSYEPAAGQTDFTLDYPADTAAAKNTCAVVRVEKNDTTKKTKITVDGYNVTCAKIGVVSSRTVQRTLSTEY